ncbi:hypothetical protein FGIG_03539 [Fasciola gigantica]|uniref:Endoplasmic reticulum lectin 1 n=1 Tax=Fasciola gigantica TaxID=46835 RepID=A0A504Z213_FASGI|nr:hypothetical protein FGIG_03539 [Fasciola gigantica]
MSCGRTLFISVLWLIFELHKSHEDSQTVQYEVLIRNTPLEKNKGFSHDFEMVSKYGHRFTCRIPLENESVPNSLPLLNNSYVHSLLSPLNRSECLLFEKDWWTYELCYRKSIIQFHSERGERQSETILGYFESEMVWNETMQFTNQSTKYHSHSYTNGSICDLTAVPRVAEVRFTCGSGSSPEIVSVDELESCKYLFVVEVPSLCSHPAFVISKPPKIEEVLCGAVPDGMTSSLSDEDKTAETKEQIKLASKDPVSHEAGPSNRRRRTCTLAKVYANIRARRQKQLLRRAVQVANQFREQLFPNFISQLPTSTSTLGGFIWRLYFQSIVRSGAVVSHRSYASYLEAYEMQMLERQLGQLFFTLMEKLDELLLRVLPLLQIPSDSFMYVSLAGDKLTGALEMRVNESRGLLVHSHYRVENLLTAMTSFQDLYEALLKPGLTKLPLQMWRFSMLFRSPVSFEKPLQRDGRCPVESELLRLLILNFRRLLRIFRRISLNLHEVEQLRSAEVELESTFRGLLDRGNFKVLLVRSAMQDKKPQDSQTTPDAESETIDKLKPVQKSKNPVVQLLKKVLQKVAPHIAGSMEVYETQNMIDGYSTFYITANEAKSKEERRIAELEKAYHFGRKEEKEHTD